MVRSRIVTTDNITEGQNNKYYTEQRFNNSFDGKAGDVDDLHDSDTDNRSWSAKVLMDYFNGTSTLERDSNGDFMPKANPQPSFYFDIDSNGNIMPRKTQILFDGNGDVMPT